MSFTLPESFIHRLTRAGAGDPRETAEQVLKLSDFYLEFPGRPTPWSEDFARSAYLGYFLPLNFIRLKAAFQEVTRFLPDAAIKEIWDFGSGPGTTQWVLESETLAPRPLFAVETAVPAMELHKQLSELSPSRWQAQFTRSAQPGAGALAVFSYAFLEMQNHLPDLNRFEHLLIVEPSTRECGRDLMEWRAKLMAAEFTPLAPCTHSQDCPLLTQSNKDWCHNRVHFAAPEWFSAIEARLPMKNRTLTYSYLLMSRSVTDQTWRGTARAIGDTLDENGKTRQMICRGPKREFLSWLHRHGPAPEIPHGALIRGVEKAVDKGSELRPPADSLEWF